jgi:hypothetical protein
MKPHLAKTRFLERLEAGGLSLNTLTAAVGIAAMLGYYADERADGCDLDGDGDMLLFQWGVYDWDEGPAFEVDITRQLIVADDEETEPQQLSLTFRFDPGAAPRGLKAGNKWCASPSELAAFRKIVFQGKALKAIGQQAPGSVKLRFGRV